MNDNVTFPKNYWQTHTQSQEMSQAGAKLRNSHVDIPAHHIGFRRYDRSSEDDDPYAALRSFASLSPWAKKELRLSANAMPSLCGPF